METPFNRDQPTAQPDYSADAAFMRNWVKVVPFDDANPYNQRMFPDAGRVGFHGRAATAAFAFDGEGFVPENWSGLPADRDYFFVNSQSFGGFHPGSTGQGLTVWERLFDALVFAGAAQLIKDIAADPTKGLSTITEGQIFHSHYGCKTGAAQDQLVLSADRGTWSVRDALTLKRAVAGDPRDYAKLVAAMHSELTGGV